MACEMKMCVCGCEKTKESVGRRRICLIAVGGWGGGKVRAGGGAGFEAQPFTRGKGRARQRSEGKCMTHMRQTVTRHLRQFSRPCPRLPWFCATCIRFAHETRMTEHLPLDCT